MPPEHPAASSSAAPPDPSECLRSIKAGLDEHKLICPLSPQALLLPSSTCERYSFEDELYGIPVEICDMLRPETFRLRCPGSAHGIEEIIDVWAAPVPAPLPQAS